VSDGSSDIVCPYCNHPHGYKWEDGEYNSPEPPPLTEAEKAHNAGAASVAASYWPAPKPTSEVEGKGKLPAFGVKRVIWGS
jgi:hypothetical protein